MMIKIVSCYLLFLLFLYLLATFYLFAWILLHHVIIGGDERKILVCFTFDWERNKKWKFWRTARELPTHRKKCIQNCFL